jgi:hypothetical protein
VEGMRAKVTEYDGMQQTLQNALINAQRSADGIVQEARTQAEGMLEQAGAEAASRMEEANRVKDAAIQEANSEKDRISANLVQLRNAANEYVSNVRGLLESTSRTVTEYESLLGMAETAIAQSGVEEAATVEAQAQVEQATFETPVEEGYSYETPVAEVPSYEPLTAPAPEAPLYEPPAPPIAEYPAAPAPEEPLYVPTEEPQPSISLQEPAFAETLPIAEPVAAVFQEPVIESAGTMEPHAYVPDIKPMDEVPVEDSPIPAMELGATEPQAFVPSIHLYDSEAPANQPPQADSPISPPEDASRLTLEDLAGSGPPPFSPEPPPVTPADVEREFAPQPEKEDQGEKHFFWE